MNESIRFRLKIQMGGRNMIRDLELLLNSVIDNRTKLLLKDSLNSYNGGAYRACVVMAIIAGAYDLKNKLKKIAYMNEEIQSICNEINEFEANHKEYERFIFDAASNKLHVLTEGVGRDLEILLNIRNQCAHSNEHVCTAEEARYVFTSVIDLLAATNLKIGKIAFKYINNKMESEFFLESHTDIELIKDEIRKKLNMLSPDSLLDLEKSIIDCLLSKTDVNSVKVKNARVVLAYLQEVFDIDRKQYYDMIIDNLINEDTEIFELLTINNKIINNLDTEQYNNILLLTKKHFFDGNKHNKVIDDICLCNKSIEMVCNNIDAILRTISFEGNAEKYKYSNRLIVPLFIMLSEENKNDALVRIKELIIKEINKDTIKAIMKDCYPVSNDNTVTYLKNIIIIADDKKINDMIIDELCYKINNYENLYEETYFYGINFGKSSSYCELASKFFEDINIMGKFDISNIEIVISTIYKVVTNKYYYKAGSCTSGVYGFICSEAFKKIIDNYEKSGQVKEEVKEKLLYFKTTFLNGDKNEL